MLRYPFEPGSRLMEVPILPLSIFRNSLALRNTNPFHLSSSVLNVHCTVTLVKESSSVCFFTWQALRISQPTHKPFILFYVSWQYLMHREINKQTTDIAVKFFTTYIVNTLKAFVRRTHQTESFVILVSTFPSSSRKKSNCKLALLSWAE